MLHPFNSNKKKKKEEKKEEVVTPTATAPLLSPYPLWSQITRTFSEVYAFACVIDSITATQLSTGELVPNQTTIYMHFIDTVKNEPVKDKTILE